MCVYIYNVYTNNRIFQLPIYFYMNDETYQLLPQIDK